MPPIEPIPQWRAYRHVRLSLVIALLYVSRISFGLQRRFRCRRRPELQFLGGKTGLRAAAADGIRLGLASLRSTGSMISTRRYYNEQRKVSLLITFNKDLTLGDETTAALEIDESSTTCSGIEIESPFEDDGKAVY